MRDKYHAHWNCYLCRICNKIWLPIFLIFLKLFSKYLQAVVSIPPAYSVPHALAVGTVPAGGRGLVHCTIDPQRRVAMNTDPSWLYSTILPHILNTTWPWRREQGGNIGRVWGISILLHVGYMVTNEWNYMAFNFFVYIYLNDYSFLLQTIIVSHIDIWYYSVSL